VRWTGKQVKYIVIKMRVEKSDHVCQSGEKDCGLTAQKAEWGFKFKKQVRGKF
jgi:hypothetical protein